MKAVVIARVSTERQEIDEQLKQTIQFAKKDLNIKETEIITCDAQGASAIKLDEKFLENINKVKQAIETYNIKHLYAYHIDRIGRNEEFLMGFKNYLISKKCNLHILNPPLVLLNPDGSVNAGMELAFTLFCTLAKQEMELKKDRFARAKNKLVKECGYVGGAVCYGYKIINKKFVINYEQANIVRTAFRLYSSGKYSYNTLSKELMERGYKVANYRVVCRWLQNELYTGKSKVSQQVVPPIITQGLFDKCREVALKQNTNINKAKSYHLGNKLIVCPICGYHYIVKTNTYRCINKQRHGGCESQHLGQVNIDKLLTRVACECEYKRLSEITKQEKKQLGKEIKILIKKIDVIDKDIERQNAKKTKITNAFIEGAIDETLYEKGLIKLNEQLTLNKKAILEYNEKIHNLEQLINSETFEDKVGLVYAINHPNEVDKKTLYEIVHKNIIKLTYEVVDDGKIITIESVFGIRRFLYRPQFRGDKQIKEIK